MKGKLNIALVYVARTVMLVYMVVNVVFVSMNYANIISLSNSFVLFRDLKDQLPTLGDLSKSAPAYASFNHTLSNLAIRTSIFTIVVSVLTLILPRIRSHHKLLVLDGIAVGMTCLVLAVFAETIIKQIIMISAV